MALNLNALCEKGPNLAKLKARLKARGAEVLAPTSQWEVLRWRSKRGVQIIYRNAAGHMATSQDAMADLENVVHNRAGSLSPVAVRKTRVVGQRRAGELAAILERDGPNCFFCGDPLLQPGAMVAVADDATTIEHLVARAHGGPEHISNKFAAHAGCNNIAGHLSAPEKIVLRDKMRADGRQERAA